MADMLEDIAGGVLGAAAGGAATRAVLRRRALRLAREGRTECALRVVVGTVPGLRPGWQPGIATLAAGRLEFRGYVGGLRFLRRSPVIVEITATAPATRRDPVGAEILRLSRNCDIVQSTTPTGTVEIAVPHPVRWQWVLANLTG